MSRVQFPVVTEVHKGGGDTPPGPDTFGIFDRYGYWFSAGGSGGLAFPLELGGLAHNVVLALNAAYETGQRDARNAVRAALGLPEEDE